MRVIQLRNSTLRRLAIVDGDTLQLLGTVPSLYDLAVEAESRGVPIAALAAAAPIDETLSYDSVYGGRSDWKILPAFDHPTDSAHCLITGTGLTHLGSAHSRNSMHQPAAAAAETDSMRMFRWGIEGGKPAAGVVGTAPEWFYKGTGDVLRACGEPLEIPAFAESGGDESEIAGLYIVDRGGRPRRVGYATGNEFSDHVFEKRNYLYLAHSKLRVCSLGPEAVIGEDLPPHLTGHAAITRGGKIIWERELASGESNMCHSLGNIEHHHFKHASHRRPGDAHVHFYGAAALSYSDGIRVDSGDLVTIAWDGLGRPLQNPIARISGDSAAMVEVLPV